MENTYWIFSNIDADGYEYRSKKSAEKMVNRLWDKYAKGELPGMLWVILQDNNGQASISLDKSKSFRMAQSTVDLTLNNQSFNSRGEFLDWLRRKQFKFSLEDADKTIKEVTA